jgi:tyrosine aminotransferase
MTTTQKVVTMMQSFGSVPDDGAIYNGYDGDYREKAWAVTASQMARNTFNPIRNIIESMKIEPNPEKELIRLSIGDPTVFGNLKPADNVVAALQTAIADGKHNGYGPSTGFVEARKAVAEHVSCAGAEIDESDVILCSGCSCALDLCIAVIADPGQNILVPKPGFPLYQTLANGIGVATREYNLIPDEGWQVDLADLESTIDSRTAAIVVNNPSNPCGSVFDRDHLRAILAVAERHCVPIIADEIYEHFVFPDGPDYHPIASLTDTVPVLSCGGLTKRYLVPGWRLGWITVHDRANVFGAGGVRKGLQSLSQRIIGANTLVQGALPQILKSTPASFFASTIDVIRSNAELAFTRLSAVPGLRPVMPSGAMYMMVGLERRNFPGFADDLDLVSALISEQSVFCLPGVLLNAFVVVRSCADRSRRQEEVRRRQSVLLNALCPRPLV